MQTYLNSLHTLIIGFDIQRFFLEKCFYFYYKMAQIWEEFLKKCNSNSDKLYNKIWFPKQIKSTIRTSPGKGRAGGPAIPLSWVPSTELSFLQQFPKNQSSTRHAETCGCADWFGGSDSPVRVPLFPEGQPAMSGDIFDCHNSGGHGLLALSVQRSGSLLNISQGRTIEPQCWETDLEI